jgi:hypothetical protein
MESLVSSLLKMQPGETRQINIFLVPDGNGVAAKKKKAVNVKLMNKEEIQLNMTLISGHHSNCG